jgi:hypothetical protein
MKATVLRDMVRQRAKKMHGRTIDSMIKYYVKRVTYDRKCR